MLSGRATRRNGRGTIVFTSVAWYQLESRNSPTWIAALSVRPSKSATTPRSPIEKGDCHQLLKASFALVALANPRHSVHRNTLRIVNDLNNGIALAADVPSSDPQTRCFVRIRAMAKLGVARDTVI
jgi:hypothetical protein